MLLLAWSASAASDTILARVNGVAITRRAVNEVVEGLIAVGEERVDAAARQRYAREALESLIELELLYQESQRRGLLVPDEAVEVEMARRKEHFADAKAYADALRRKGLSEEDVRHETRRTMAVNRFLEGVVWKDIRITPEQVQDFYGRHRDEFRHPADLRCRHILLRAGKDAPSGERQRAKQRADDLLTQLRNGADFAELAKIHSEDPASAASGGDLGYFTLGELQPDFEAAVAALQPGQISEVVRTDLGYHIIQLTERREAGISPPSEVEDRLRALLIKRERQKRQAELVERLRQAAKVEYVR
jgi:peptidyl-prolyl cis-trans isomerase C